VRAFHVLDMLQTLSLCTDLGDTKTLLAHPASTSHGRLTEAPAPGRRRRPGADPAWPSAWSMPTTFWPTWRAAWHLPWTFFN
jgi:hypothetical protein